jgi:ribonuclease R
VRLGAECSDLERRAEAAERELVKLKLLLFLKSKLGAEMDAIVTGVEAFGLFVQGIDLPAEGLVPLDTLPDDTYRYDRASHTLSGRRAGQSFRLGDRLRVAVDRVDVDRRELNFRLVGRQRRARVEGRSRDDRPPRGRPRPPRPAARKAQGRAAGGRKQRRRG